MSNEKEIALIRRIKAYPLDQLWYTWSTLGFGSTAGDRVRAASKNLMDINSERVKSMDRYLRYSLPPGTDGYSMTPETAPLCLTLLNTGKEYVLIHKKYTGKDGVGRRGAFFIHVLARLPEDFSLKDAISLWRSPSWQTADTDNRNLELAPVRLAQWEALWEEVKKIQFAEVEEHLPLIIQAYLTRQPGQRLYIIAESADKIAALISGLAFSLPRNLLGNLTFSSYESDITKATTDIVGTCWIAKTDRDRRAEQAALTFCKGNGIVLDCRRPAENSQLIEYPLAAKFAKYATECLVFNEMEQLEKLRADAQEISDLAVAKFLEAYKNTVVDVKSLSKENIEFYLTTPYYTLRMLKTPNFKGRIIDLCCGDGDWWNQRLKSILMNLHRQSKQNPELAEQLKKLAEKAIPVAVATMKGNPAPMQVMSNGDNALAGIVTRDDESVFITMLDVMYCAEPPSFSSSVWISFLKAIGNNNNALSFLASRWKIYTQLLSYWAPMLSIEHDPLISPVLSLATWPRFGEFLALHLPDWWYAIGTDLLLKDPSKTLDPQTVNNLGQKYAQTIETRLKQFVNNAQTRLLAAELVIRLAESHYIGSKGYYLQVEKLLQTLLSDEQLLLQATNLVIRLSESGYTVSEDHIKALLQSLLANDPSGKEARDFYTQLRQSDKFDVMPLVPIMLNSRMGEKNLAEALDTIFQTDQERARFFTQHGRHYLNTSGQFQAMLNLFAGLVKSGYQEKMEWLFILLDSAQGEAHAGEVIQTASLKVDQLVMVLEHYGLRYLLSPLPTLAPLVVYIFDWLAQGGHLGLGKTKTLSALFDPQVSENYLKQLLDSARLSPEEGAAFMEQAGKRYIQSVPRPTLLYPLSEDLVKRNSPIKLDLLLIWFGIFPEENLLRNLLKAPSITPQDRLTILKKYGQQYLSSPRRSGAMEDLFVDVMNDNPTEKLELLDIAFLAPIREEKTIEMLLLAAHLPRNEEIQFLEYYGPKFLSSYLASPCIVEYIRVYLQAFTFDDLERETAKKFLQFLLNYAQKFPGDMYKLIQNWYDISTFLEEPSAAKSTTFLVAINGLHSTIQIHSAPSEKLTEMLANALTFCVRDTADLTYLIQLVSSFFTVNTVELLDKLQLMYKMAYCVGQKYGKEHREALLIPYIKFAPYEENIRKLFLPQQSYSMPAEKYPIYMEYVVTTLFENLSLKANQITFERLSMHLQSEPEGVKGRWQKYLAQREASVQQVSDSAVDQDSRPEAAGGFFVYWYATFRMGWALRSSRRIGKIVSTWEKYKPVLEKHPERITGNKLTYAIDFLAARGNGDDHALAQLFNLMEYEGYRFTRDEMQLFQQAKERVEDKEKYNETEEDRMKHINGLPTVDSVQQPSGDETVRLTPSFPEPNMDATSSLPLLRSEQWSPKSDQGKNKPDSRRRNGKR